MTPLRRFYSLLELDRKDVYQIFFYAMFAGLISLSLPLGIQAIVNFIQSGRMSASWVVLIIIVVIGVALVGILSLMQLRITENLQQKIFIRSSFEFAARLPKINFTKHHDNYPPEVANRFFDTLTIQKGTSKLLLDFSAAILQIVFGIILLSIYHPFFILFGVMLLALLYIIFKFSYNKGLETSLQESKKKYQVAGWLQEIARNYMSFKKDRNFDFALSKNDEITANYLVFREKHFNVLKRQFSQLILFKVLITACLLAIGGYLVLTQQMNIGQFVAAEIIILLVINSVEKIILGLETFYDVLTSIEKIGEVTDMEIEQEEISSALSCYTHITLEAADIKFKYPGTPVRILDNISLKIDQGEKIVLEGPNGSGKTTLMRILAGMIPPTTGAVFINDDTFRKIDLRHYRSHTGSIISGELPFEGTILENITFNDPDVSDMDLRWALDAVDLSKFIRTLRNGLETRISPEGKQLSSSYATRVLVARSIIRKPLILFLEDPTERMDHESARHLIDFLMSPENRWTVVVTSKNQYWTQKATRVITMNAGQITNDKLISHA
jgi:ABC-type bacteriocin/lantibiotic exporter with double-glycine peptidase domain